MLTMSGLLGCRALNQVYLDIFGFPLAITTILAVSPSTTSYVEGDVTSNSGGSEKNDFVRLIEKKRLTSDSQLEVSSDVFPIYSWVCYNAGIVFPIVL